MSKENFVKGAAILGISGLIVKILGAIYKIPLTNLIGTQGIAYYQPAYTIYNLLLAISLTGFPTAIARIVAEKRALNNYQGAYQVYSVSLIGLFFVGVVTSVLTYVLADPIVNLMGSPKSYYSLVALVPALMVVPVLSAYRGFFQGTQNMMPLALSQLLEQVFRVVVGFTLAYVLLNNGLEKAAAGANFGASVGSIIALIVVFLFFVARKKLTQKEIENSDNNSLDTVKNVIRDLLIIAIPITIGACISPLMGLADVTLVNRILSTMDFTADQIDSMYGQLSGMAQSIINFPQAFSTAIAVSLVPVMTEAYTKRDKAKLNQTSDMGIKISLVIALPCGVGIFMLAAPIMALLFPSVGSEVHASSGILLQILSISVIFLILVQAFTAMLQAVNKQMLPVKNLFIGLLVKIVLSYMLISIKSININGAAISTGVAYIVATILNYIDIRKYTTIKLSKITKIAALPLLSTLIMAVVVFIVYKLGGFIIKSGSILTALSIMAGGLAYVVALFATGTITSSDLELIPKGQKLKRFVKK